MVGTTKGNHDGSSLTYGDIEKILTGQGLSVAGGENFFYKKDHPYKLNHVYQLKIEGSDENKIIEIWLPSGKGYHNTENDVDLETIKDDEFSDALLISTSIGEYLENTPGLFNDSGFKEMEKGEGVIRFDAPGRGRILNQDELEKYYREWKFEGKHRGHMIPPKRVHSEPPTKRYLEKVKLSEEPDSLGNAISEFNGWIAKVDNWSKKIHTGQSNVVTETLSER